MPVSRLPAVANSRLPSVEAMGMEVGNQGRTQMQPVLVEDDQDSW